MDKELDMTRQPDDPGYNEYPEPDVGHYSGWVTILIWTVLWIGMLGVSYILFHFALKWIFG